MTADTSRSQQLWRRWDRTFRWSLVASVLLHVLVLLLFRETHPVPELEFSAAGEDAGDPVAAAGGGMEVIALQIEQTAPQPEPIVEPIPEPDVEIEPVVIEPPQEPTPPAAGSDAQSDATGDGRGQDAGPGTQTGTGSGDAGTSESGTGDAVAPTPRGLILPPSDRPASVRGQTVTVYVFVDPRGAVVRDSTRLNPSTGDRGFDNRLRQQAAEWKFRPAMRAGQAIAAWFPYTITF